MLERHAKRPLRLIELALLEVVAAARHGLVEASAIGGELTTRSFNTNSRPAASTTTVIAPSLSVRATRAPAAPSARARCAPETRTCCHGRTSHGDRGPRRLGQRAARRGRAAVVRDLDHIRPRHARGDEQLLALGLEIAGEQQRASAVVDRDHERLS